MCKHQRIRFSRRTCEAESHMGYGISPSGAKALNIGFKAALVWTWDWDTCGTLLL